MRVYNYFHFHETAATRKCTNTSDHFTKKKKQCIPLSDTVNPPIPSAGEPRWRINCAMDAEPA